MYRRASFILLELLIALGLTGTLLALLLRFFVATIHMDQKIARVHDLLQCRQYIQMRLSHVFTSLLPEEPVTVFHAGKELFVSLMDQGIDPDPLFSGKVQAKIFLENEQLILQTASCTQQTSDRKEVLGSHVQSLQFQYLSPEKGWCEEWPTSEKSTPPLIRVIVTQHNKELKFAFAVLSSKYLITYPGDS